MKGQLPPGTGALHLSRPLPHPACPAQQQPVLPVRVPGNWRGRADLALKRVWLSALTRGQLLGLTHKACLHFSWLRTLPRQGSNSGECLSNEPVSASGEMILVMSNEDTTKSLWQKLGNEVWRNRAFRVSTDSWESRSAQCNHEGTCAQKGHEQTQGTHLWLHVGLWQAGSKGGGAAVNHSPEGCRRAPTHTQSPATKPEKNIFSALVFKELHQVTTWPLS